MRGLTNEEYVVLAELAKPGDELIDIGADEDGRGERLRDGLVSRGLLESHEEPDKEDQDYVWIVWSITALGRTALRVCTRVA